jgi:Tfp pilus assembly protein PilO
MKIKLPEYKDFRRWKVLLLGAVSLVLLFDLVLVIFIWRSSAANLGDSLAERDRLRTEVKLLNADIRRAQLIKADLANVDKKSDEFAKDELPPSSGGYSNIVADLGAIAEKSGLKTSVVGYRQKELKGHNVDQIEVTAAVEGDYESLVKFINGLERAKNFYLLDSLTLNSGSGDTIKLSLALRTFFRS